MQLWNQRIKLKTAKIRLGSNQNDSREQIVKNNAFLYKIPVDIIEGGKVRVLLYSPSFLLHSSVLLYLKQYTIVSLKHGWLSTSIIVNVIDKL